MRPLALPGLATDGSVLEGHCDRLVGCQRLPFLPGSVEGGVVELAAVPRESPVVLGGQPARFVKLPRCTGCVSARYMPRVLVATPGSGERFLAPRSARPRTCPNPFARPARIASK